MTNESRQRERLRRSAAPMARLGGAVAALVQLLTCTASLGAGSFEAERSAMIRTIESYNREARRVLGRDAFDPRVIEAMRTVPRHAFVPESQQRFAYEDRPLAIGYGQTISQPLIVALMTDLLNPWPDHVVLEVGTGSGYQAAVLARLVRLVYTIEIVTPLAERAKSRLAELGYENIEVRSGDGYNGWPEVSPFDGILVTATADHVPPRLVEQLKPGGRMVIPLGERLGSQYLTLVEKSESGEVRTRKLLAVKFVPLTGR